MSENTAETPVLDDEALRRKLTPQQYHILREHGTEPAGTSKLNYEKRDGLFHCAACDAPLFSSETKYESGSGWPSFFAALPGATETSIDTSHGMRRVEVHCATCKSHLGHLFPDGPKPTGERYCMNGASMAFTPSA